MSIRKQFIGYTSKLSGILPLDVLAAATGHQFVIPFYHIVSDGDCPHVKHLYSFKNVKQFTSDIEWLAKEYQPLAATDIHDVIAGKYKGKKTMLLTFDDGLREMYDVVVPILLAKGIPAVFFINTDYIDNRALMFRYKASLAVELMNLDAAKNQQVLAARSDKALVEAAGGELESLSQTFLSEYKPYMTTAQVQDLINKGFSIGSHSASHPYYADLSLQQQLGETLSSMKILKEQFNLAQQLFAFPFTDHGVGKEFFSKVYEAGMDYTFGGAGIKNDINKRQLQRVPMEGWDATAEQILKSEYLYYLLRAPLFKNTIQR